MDILANAGGGAALEPGPELTLTNARIVRPNEIIAGTLNINDGHISDVDTGNSAIPSAIDVGEDFIIPGLVDIHTDNVEKHLEPRPGVRWPSTAALVSHDRQICGAGITTVYDSLYVGGGENPKDQKRADNLAQSIDGLETAARYDLLGASHFLHLRCEVPWQETAAYLERFIDRPMVGLISVMDHTPGQRQWRDMEKWRVFNSRKFSPAELDEILESRFGGQAQFAADNRRRVVDLAREHGIALASHDDTTEEHVEEAAAHRIEISEFPCTIEAARLARAHDMKIVMGAPNLVMGGSHSGNMAAGDLADQGLLDGLASDYVPISLLQGAFHLHLRHGFKLPDAVAAVTHNPALMVGLEDRGMIEPGKRADLVRVRLVGEFPAVKAVWSGGQQIA